MQNKSTLNRKGSKPIAIAVCVLAIISYLLYVRYSDYVRAYIWHREHGDYVKLDHHSLRLPVDWWLKGKDLDGSLILREASSRFNRSSSTISISPVGPQGIFETEGKLLEATRTMISSLNGTRDLDVLKPAYLTMVQSPSTDFVCVQEMEPDDEFSLKCAAAKLQYRLFCTGLKRTEAETKGVLSSFE